MESVKGCKKKIQFNTAVRCNTCSRLFKFAVEVHNFVTKNSNIFVLGLQLVLVSLLDQSLKYAGRAKAVEGSVVY